MDETEALKLKNQLCFPIYAASRMVTKLYQPLLGELDLTYPQYLILLILWEHGEMSVMGIGKLLYLSTNTLTPLLKRMESNGIIQRIRSKEDERKVLISLTQQGKGIEKKACSIPKKLVKGFGEEFSMETAMRLKKDLESLIGALG